MLTLHFVLALSTTAVQTDGAAFEGAGWRTDLSKHSVPLTEILIGHEIVNDRLGGRPVAVTFCPPLQHGDRLRPPGGRPLRPSLDAGAPRP